MIWKRSPGARRRQLAFRRRTAVVTVLTTAALTLVGTARATAPTAPEHRPPTVTAGAARFEVLSPTLIRTEYAGDHHFTDAPTFNAVGRDGFRPTPYTATRSGGWLTVRTGAMTLRYRLDSGPFTAQNLITRLSAGGSPVTAAPWNPVPCGVGALCEAEDLAADGPGVASDHKGATGRGFLAGFETTGSTARVDIDVPTSGAYDFATRYANATGGDGQYVTRTLSVAVDGDAAHTMSLPVTANWDAWSLARVPLSLTAGRHTLTVTRAAGDSGNVNVDSVALVASDGAYPPVSATAVRDCAYGTDCEAEDGRLGGSAAAAGNHQGYTGTGFAAGLNQNATLGYHVTGVPADGTYDLHVRYANGQGGDGLHQARTATVTVNATTGTLTLPATDDWDDWNTATVPVTLKAGADDLTIGCPETTSCHVNADTVAVTAAGDASPQPHLALGGYRRGLDGVNGDNGAPTTTPGVLYKDGWYLLDDTTSALFDPATGKVTGRPDHGGQPYRDGYLFGYGHDYKQALSDLATLTGPPKLLPRWAYGVWYSEYMDRTAADYEQRILPDFRSEGVPLDVLVTDTDFKSPNTWSGWEIDSAKYPDPKALFDWSAAQGLHNTLNIHPSILGSDPQFATAMATAKNKLRRTGCAGTSDCYTFDFGDPDQLKAYMDLHHTMEQQGNDFWWLDWCCDASSSSLSGVTPDSWINQQYASAADRTVGRGFVISRAYGSLQAGGYGGPTPVSTGPWADKRTTIHFTGDTASTWGTLRMEVGYAPGESAATGMSAISHDIGGHVDTTGLKGAETWTSDGTQHRTNKLPDDLYARWVQLGTFQPIDRLHSNHSDRLPWQYGDAARKSADAFLNLREDLVPYTYTLSRQAALDGTPVVRPMYLEYPEEAAAYTAANSEYLYGPDVLVAPVTAPGDTATTSVWFPPGQWTDWFTGKTYQGGTTQQITSDLDTMPVFVKAGGILPTRTADVTDDVRNPLTDVTLHVTTGAPGAFHLYEDDGTSTRAHSDATTAVRYTEKGARHTLSIGGARGSFPGQVHRRSWTVAFGDTDPPHTVLVAGRKVGSGAYHWDAATRVLTVTVPPRSVRSAVTVDFT